MQYKLLRLSLLSPYYLRSTSKLWIMTLFHASLIISRFPNKCFVHGQAEPCLVSGSRAVQHLLTLFFPDYFLPLELCLFLFLSFCAIFLLFRIRSTPPLSYTNWRPCDGRNRVRCDATGPTRPNRQSRQPTDVRTADGPKYSPRSRVHSKFHHQQTGRGQNKRIGSRFSKAV